MLKVAIGVFIGYVLGAISMFLQIKETSDYSALRSELRIKEEENKQLKDQIEQMTGKQVHCPAPKLMLGDELMWPEEV